MEPISRMTLRLTRSEEARRAPAELEAIAAGLQVHEIAELVAHGRALPDRGSVEALHPDPCPVLGDGEDGEP
jgi:hypothetical protein